MIFSLIKLLIGVILILFVLSLIRTWQVQHDDREVVFLKGNLPSPLPDGFYHGSVPGYKVSWLGKKFNATDHIGINIFDDGNGLQGERYPFKTSLGKGLEDKNLDVLKIDYDISRNPFWLRSILDEIVQTAPGTYLGKLHVRFLGYSAALGYFTLTK